MNTKKILIIIQAIFSDLCRSIMYSNWLALPFLGMIQGFTEVFPISSSAHLILYGQVLGYEITFGKILFLHLATFLGILIYYRKDVAKILTGKYGNKMILFILISFTATAIVGLLLENAIVRLVDRPPQVSQLLIINGFVLAAASLIPTSGTRTISNLSLYDFIFIGLLQGLAGFPGISRLGLTLIGCSLRKMKWSEAVRLSFILSLPTILAANLYRALESFEVSSGNWYSFPVEVEHYLLNLVSFGITFGTCLLGIYLLTRTIYLGRRLLTFFGIYCAITGFFFWHYLGLI